MEADQAHEPEPVDVDWSREAMEQDPVFVPGRRDRMVLLPECPVFR